MSELVDTLKRINWHHGRGDIDTVNLDSPTGGYCIVTFSFIGRSYGGKPTIGNLCDPEYPRFSIRGNRVTFRGVTRKIGYKIR